MEILTIDTLFQYSLTECYFLKKFGYKWLRRTFGRVSPSRARYYHSRSLQRKIFQAWQDQSCYATPWILSVRADCNNKYRIVTRHWGAWKRFIQLCRRKRDQEARADHFLYTSYARILLPAWKEFVLLQKTRRQSYDTAAEVRTKHLLEQYFHIWREELSAMREYRCLECNALSVWYSSVQRRWWCVWVRGAKGRLEQEQLLAKAEVRYNNKLIQICFERLHLYTMRKREGKSLNQIVIRNYERRLMLKLLRRWRVRRWKEKNIRDKQRQIESLASQCNLRRKWLAWLGYTSHCKEEKERNVVGRNFRTKALKARGWKAILNAHKNRRALEWKGQVALQLWVLWRYRHAWNNWEERMEARIEVKQEPVSRIARQHYNKVVAARALIAFKAHLLDKKSKRQRYKIGEDHYEKTLKLKSLSALKRYVRIQCVERKHSSLSSRFLHEILLDRFFYVWVARLEKQRETNELMEIAEHFNAVISVQCCFSLWKDKYIESNREHMRILAAVLNYSVGLQRKSIAGWKKFVLYCKQRREAKDSARKRYQIKVVKKCFLRMKLIHDRNQFIRKRCHQLISVLGVSSVRKAFKAWKQFILMAREERRELMRAENHWKIKVQVHVLREWQQNIEFLKAQKEMNRKAGLFRINYLTSRYFHIWKSTRLLMLEQGNHETELAAKVTAVIQRGCLYRCFWGWLILKDKAVIKRYNGIKADSYQSNCLLKRSMSQWGTARTKRQQLLLGYQHAIWFYRSSLQARTYTQWRLQLNRQLYSNYRRTIALWHWSRALEKRVFVALRSNASENRRKWLRYDRASGLFRDRVIMKGILQILHTGNAMLAAEENSVLKKIERNTKFSWGCALRCARIWRQKTQARKGKKESTGVIRCGLAVPDLDTNQKLPNLLSGLDSFWSEITDLTIKTSSLPAPRIPEYLKQKCHPITFTGTELRSDSLASTPEQLPTIEPNSDHDLVSVASIPASTDDKMVGISGSDVELLRETKELLIQLSDNKLLLKSVKEGLLDSNRSEEAESSYEIRNRVHEMEEQIQISEVTIKQNISKLSGYFKMPANFQK